MSEGAIADKVDFRASSAHAAFSQQGEASTSTKEARRWLKNHTDDDDEFDEEDEDNDEENSIYMYEELNVPSRKAVRPARPPIPDLRFEQSYRKAIAKADGVWWKIALITIKDQVLFTLAQGFLWQLALVGIRSWRLGAMSHGSSYGARLSNWWAGVNNNKI